MMDIDFLHTRNRVALLMGQFLVLILSVFYIYHTYTTFIRPDQIARSDFQPTTCTVLSKKLTSHGSVWTKYRADFLINYNVGGVQYNRWVSSNGMDRTLSLDSTTAIEALGGYSIGSQYTCYYDPVDPSVSVLVLRQNWLDTFPLMLPAVVFLIVAYYLFLNLLSFIMPALSRHHS